MGSPWESGRRAGRGPAVLRALLLVLSFAIGCGAPQQPPSVILITLDTTRADHLGCYGCSWASTPVLDSLSLQATLFENAVTPIPITLPAHVSVLTGRTPLGHGVRDNGWRTLQPGVATLAELLAAEGYSTAAFVSAYVLKSRYDVSRGFQHYDDDLIEERPASETTARALAWLRQQPPAPLLLWVHYFDPHLPLTPPEPYASETRGTAYDAEISAMDASLGELLAALARFGYTTNAHVIIVADHGEGLGERGGYRDHGLLLYEEASRVPLLWRTPGQRRGQRVGELVGCVDIYPTVLDLLGIERDERTEGVSLRPLLGGRERALRTGLYCETLRPYITYEWSPLYAWRTAHEKYIAAPQAELYDLAHDPQEQLNLETRRPTRAESLRAELLSYAERWTPLRATEPGPLDAEERAMLESLGYVQSAGRERSDESADAPRIGELADLADPKEHIAFEASFVRANRARRLHIWEAALDAYDEIIAALPDSPVLPLGVAEALLGAGRPAEALTWLEKHLARRPGDPDAHLLRGHALHRQGRYTEALEAYALVPASEADVGLRKLRANAQIMLGRYDSARAEYRALEEDFAAVGHAETWERCMEATDLLARRGTTRPASGAVDLAAQVNALVVVGLSPVARELVAASEGAQPDSLLATLRADIAYGSGEWCAARDAYQRASELGARTPRNTERRAEAARKCRADEARRRWVPGAGDAAGRKTRQKPSRPTTP